MALVAFAILFYLFSLAGAAGVSHITFSDWDSQALGAYLAPVVVALLLGVAMALPSQLLGICLEDYWEERREADRSAMRR